MRQPLRIFEGALAVVRVLIVGAMATGSQISILFTGYSSHGSVAQSRVWWVISNANGHLGCSGSAGVSHHSGGIFR